MASLRVDWNGGFLTSSSSSLNSVQQHKCMGRTLSFSRQVNKNFLTDHKPHQQMAQGHRFSPAANRGGESINKTSNSSNFDHLIRSDRACAGWTEISNVHTNKRIIDDEEDKPENLDQWMRDSVVEIVSNIGEAPFLVHIYSEDETKDSSSSSSSTAIRLVVEKAIAESWPIIKGRWKGGRSPIPNGVILVEELKIKDDEALAAVSRHDHEETLNNAGNNSQLQYSTTRTWGLLIQAKGVNRTACYILKTCRVQTFLGFCTHFCLVRVECFVDDAETQLKKLWLQR